MKKFYVLLLSVFFTGLIAFGQTKTTIESIAENPEQYSGENVEFEGFVTRYVDSPTVTTSFFEMQGYYGARILVTTSENQPGINNFYRVTGILTLNPQRRSMLVETKREPIPRPD